MKNTCTLFFTLFACLSSYSQLSLQDSLIAHYPMDGNAMDISGNGNHGTPMGAQLTTDRFGNANGAYLFDGLDDYMDLLSNQKFKPQQFPVTIAAWIELHDYNFNLVFKNDFEENTYNGVWLNMVNGRTVGAYGDGGLVSPTNRRSVSGTTVIPLNTWAHVAVVIRGPLDMDVFVNGQNDCGVYSGSGGNLVYSEEDGTLGRDDDFSSPGPFTYYKGKMEEIRFYGRELSLTEIRILAETNNNLSSINSCQGDPVSLDASDGSSTYQWFPSTNLSCTTCSSPIASPSDTTLYRVIRTNALACPDTSFFQVNARNCNVSVCDPAFTLQDSLVAHYPMSGNLLDASGFGNHGSGNGPILTTDRFGNPNEAYFFDGVDDEVVLIANSPKFKPPLPVTIAAWVEINDYDFNHVFQNDFILGSYHGPWMTIVNGKAVCEFGDGGPSGPNWRRSKTGTTTLALNNWYHLAVVMRGAGNMDIYVNGVQDCGTYSGTGSTIMAYSMANGNLGAGTPPGNAKFHGKMDDVRLYGRELCIYEIRELADYNDLDTVNICSGDSTSLDADDGSSTYQWSPSQGLSCNNCPNPIANPTDTTLYQVVRDNGFTCLDTFFFQVNPEICSVTAPCDTTILDADFQYSTNGLVLTLMNASRGPDSGIDHWRWDFGDGNRASIFQPDTIDHQYFQPGTYNVCLFVTKFYDELNVCNDTLCQTVMVDSISSGYGESLSELGWNIYPNPATETIFLEQEAHHGKPIDVEIYNLAGELLYQESHIIRPKSPISIEFLPKGMYILQIKDEAVHGYWKFVKE